MQSYKYQLYGVMANLINLELWFANGAFIGAILRSSSYEVAGHPDSVRDTSAPRANFYMWYQFTKPTARTPSLSRADGNHISISYDNYCHEIVS